MNSLNLQQNVQGSISAVVGLHCACVCHLFSADLTDDHILELAGNITDKNDLHKLGVRVLGLKLKQVNSVHTDCGGINDAASKILQIWRRKQNSPQEAFMQLCVNLRQIGWGQIAQELEHLQEATSEGAGLTTQSKEVFCFCFIVLLLDCCQKKNSQSQLCVTFNKCFFLVHLQD